MALFGVGFSISATKVRLLAETENAQRTLKWILISTLFQTTNAPFLSLRIQISSFTKIWNTCSISQIWPFILLFTQDIAISLQTRSSNWSDLDKERWSCCLVKAWLSAGWLLSGRLAGLLEVSACLDSRCAKRARELLKSCQNLDGETKLQCWW